MEKRWQKNYEQGIPHEIDVSRYHSICDILEKSYKQFGDKDCFYNMGTTLTYDEIKLKAYKFASYLQNTLKLSKGDRVAIMMPNILQYPVALFGTLHAGMVGVNVNPLYTARELKHQLNDSGAKVIVIFENSCKVLEEIVAETSVEHILTTQIGDFLKFPKNYLVNFVIKNIKKMVPEWNLPNAKSFKDAVAAGDASLLVRPAMTKDDIAFLQYTGGTTGVSKGAILSHGNIVANLIQARTWLSNCVRPGREIIITPLPLYHIFSLTANCFCMNSLGALNVLITNPRDMPGFIKELKKFKFTAITGVNTLFNGLLNRPDFSSIDFSHINFSLGGGMAVQRATAEKWKEITGRPIIEAYGLTETSPAATLNPMSLKEFNGSIGLPISSTELCIKDDEGKTLESGEVGEICIKGPQVMVGYWNRPDETAKVMTSDGFFKTGDVGKMDEEGFFYLVDRKKDMILVSGFNVFPNEIEDIMCTNEKVFECAVVGVPNEKSGEIVKIFIVKKDDTLTVEEVIAYAKKNLTGYKVPKIVEFRDDLPKSNVGKILRKDLRS